MNKLIILSAFVSLSTVLAAQNMDDAELVEKACMDYIEGFYSGDSERIKACMKPSLHKFGYWKDAETGEYGDPIVMTYEGAISYAESVKEKQKFPSENAPKDVKVLDVSDHIAAAKVTAWWGYDYLLLSKEGDKWMIEQVLWEGPLTK